MNKKVIIATGGTGGHVFPAIAVADRLKNDGMDVCIVGDEKLSKFVDQITVKYKIITSAKTKSIKSVFLIIKGIIESILFLKKEKPNLVIGFGSYATFPILVASVILKIPLALHEQNMYAGKVNRWFQKYAKVIFTSFPEIYGFSIDNSNKIRYVGNPVRNNIKELSKHEYKYPDFKNGEKFNILIIAGSGGASFFGNEFIKFIDYTDDNFKKNVNIIQQVKKEDLLKTKDTYKSKYISSNVRTFFDDMEEKYRQAHLVICRSGATTISELSVIGLPTIFFPSPFVANNHQYKNVENMLKQGSCIVFEQDKFRQEKFGEFISKIILDKHKLFELSKNIKQFGVVDADINISKVIKEIL